MDSSPTNHSTTLIKIIPHRVWITLAGVILCIVMIFTSNITLEGNQELNLFTVQRARVLAVEDDRLSPDPFVENLHIGRQTLELELLTGAHAGQRVRIDNTLSRFFNIRGQENMTLLVSVVTDDTGTIAHLDVFGYARDSFIYGFVGLFFLILILVARKKGLYAVISLIFTLTAIVFFMIPGILQGESPILLATVTAAFTATFSILMIGDISFKSLAAIGGTVVGVAIAGVVGVIAGNISHISGMHIAHAEEVIFQAGQVPIRVPELLFAGIIISTLGAVIDVGMSISSAVFEIKDLNREISMKQLYKSGMNIGRDIMGTMSNTLILAFAGSSITVLIIMVSYQLPYMRLINLDILAVEIIQGISASIGLVLAVPVTALVAAWLAAGRSKN